MDCKAVSNIREKCFYRKENQNYGEIYFVIYLTQHKHFFGPE